MFELVSRDIDCPYCGESINVLVDPSIPDQNYIEDCQVCCRPIVFDVLVDAGWGEGEQGVIVRVRHENE